MNTELNAILANYLTSEQLTLVSNAYELAHKSHYHQTRRSGEPYITHPIAVATILAQIKMDANSIAAALLHDVAEDCDISIEQIAKATNTNTAKIVDGVTKLHHLEQETNAIKQANNFQKMALAMIEDARVIVVKLADRLHNMRTLGNMPRAKQKTIAKETEEIYAKIAKRLGMGTIADELDDLSFKHQYPVRYMLVNKATATANTNNQDYLQIVKTEIEQKLVEYKIDCSVVGRKKSPASIYKKMRGDRERKKQELQSQQKQSYFLSFYKIMDIHGFRVIVKSLDDCYRTLGALHQLHKPIPGRFKDYISNAKPNGYQSLHTTLIGPKNYPIEIQIRTEEMHNYAYQGIAVHWFYKDSAKHISFEQLHWLNQLKELEEFSVDAVDFLNTVKKDFYEKEIYVFSPQHTIIALPSGASAIDFAYHIHTNIGDRAISCKINRITANLTTTLLSGQTVEIITAKEISIQPAWLNFAITAKASAHIKHYIHKQSELSTKKANVKTLELQDLGKNIVYSSLNQLGLESNISNNKLQIVADKLNMYSMVLYQKIGTFELSPFIFIRTMYDLNDTSSARLDLGESHKMQIAKCCMPILGDKIVATITNKGLIMHRQFCRSIMQEDYLLLNWHQKPEESAPTHIAKLRIRMLFSNKGAFTNITNLITSNDAMIKQLNTIDLSNSMSFVDAQIAVKSRLHLMQIIQKIKIHPDVIRVFRVFG